MIFEDNYIYFVKALKYVINEKGHGCQKVIAADAGISDSLISMALNPNIKNKPGFVAQQKIANAAGYSYVSFLELGRSLLEPTSDGSATTPPKKAPPSNVIQFNGHSVIDPKTRKMYQDLDTILKSGDEELIDAIKMNLMSFRKKIELQKQIEEQGKRIAALEASIK